LNSALISESDPEVHIFHSCAKVRNPTRDKKRRREGRKYKILIMQTLVRELYTFVVSDIFLFFLMASVFDVSLQQSRISEEDEFPVIRRAISLLYQ
jgi:hypothetical protein